MFVAAFSIVPLQNASSKARLTRLDLTHSFQIVSIPLPLLIRCEHIDNHAVASMKLGEHQGLIVSCGFIGIHVTSCRIIACRSGGSGRHQGLKIPCFERGVSVRVRSPAQISSVFRFTSSSFLARYSKRGREGSSSLQMGGVGKCARDGRSANAPPQIAQEKISAFPAHIQTSILSLSRGCRRLPSPLQRSHPCALECKRGGG
jgi:hypothetical protein